MLRSSRNLGRYLPPASGDRSWYFRPGTQTGMGYSTIWIPDGDAGTEKTVQKMIALTQDGANQPGIRQAAQRAIERARVRPKDYAGELRAIHEYVRANVRYALDPRGKEQVSHPLETLFNSGTEDCESIMVLEASMAGSMGHGAIFRTIKADPTRPNEYSHVYNVLAFRDGAGVHLIASDPTTLNAPFGWEPPLEQVFFRRDWVAIPP